MGLAPSTELAANSGLSTDVTSFGFVGGICPHKSAKLPTKMASP